MSESGHSRVGTAIWALCEGESAASSLLALGMGKATVMDRELLRHTEPRFSPLSFTADVLGISHCNEQRCNQAPQVTDFSCETPMEVTIFSHHTQNLIESQYMFITIPHQKSKSFSRHPLVLSSRARAMSHDPQPSLQGRLGEYLALLITIVEIS